MQETKKLNSLPWEQPQRFQYLRYAEKSADSIKGKTCIFTDDGMQEFDANKLQLGDPGKPNAFGSKIAVTYDGKALKLLSPAMFSKWGVSTFKNAKGSNSTLDLDFGTGLNLPQNRDFFNVCRAIDVALFELARKERRRLFPALNTDHTPDSDFWKFFKGITRIRDGKTPDPKFGLKITEDSAFFAEKVSKKRKFNPDDLFI